MDRKITEVQVEALLEDRLGQILLGRTARATRDDRPSAPATGASSVTGDNVRSVSPDAVHNTVLDERLVDGEAIAHLGADTRGAVDDDLVEHGPARV